MEKEYCFQLLWNKKWRFATAWVRTAKGCLQYVYPSGISEVSKCMVRGENKANLTMIRRVIPSLQGVRRQKGDGSSLVTEIKAMKCCGCLALLAVLSKHQVTASCEEVMFLSF